MSDTELLPCPFCGGPARLYYQLDDLSDWVVACNGCGARSCPDGIRYDRDLAIADRNTRRSYEPTEEKDF